MQRKGRVLFGVLAGALALAPLVTACGVPEGEYQNVKQQLATKEQAAAALQQQLNAQQKELTDTKQKAESAAKTGILLSVPNAPPRATPVPPPPGATPAPPPALPAPRTVPLYLYHDTVTSGPGESQFNVDPNLSCVRSSLFKRGMHVTFRMEAVDTSTGKILQAPDVEKAAVLLPSGEVLNMRFGRHGATEDAPWFWTTAWDIPMNYPLGVLDYTIEVVASNGKRMTTDQPLTVSLPARNMDTRVQIVE
ncbi:MAG: hypothetical protein HY332_21175 [Chloroflexi bacterium]|nr:hypothetical protein [Chloroflexota bacterium]